MSSTADTVSDDPIRAAFSDTAGSLVVVVSDAELLASILEGAAAVDTVDFRVLCSRGAANDVLTDFIVASRTAELVDRGTLAIRTAAEVPDMPLIAGDDRLTRLVTVGDSVYTLETTEEPFVSEAIEYFEDLYEAAEDYPIKAPPISTLRRELAEAFGEEILDEFEAMIASEQGGGLRIADRFILLAARHRELLYDIGRWGEDLGISSRATFSRAKARLEREGIITTEKVPIEHGRPRHQLLLTDRFREASMDDLLRIADDLVNGRVRGARVPA